MLAVLALAGSGALGLSLWISVAIVVLMIAVGLSYRQLIRASSARRRVLHRGRQEPRRAPRPDRGGRPHDRVRPHGGSGSPPGVAAITSAVPGLSHDAVPLGLAAIAILPMGNLRGVRQAGALFSAPTYASVLAIFALIAAVLVDASGHGFTPTRSSASSRSRASPCCWCCAPSRRAPRR